MFSPAVRLPADPTSALDGGAACLAYANTIEWRRGEAIDHLTDYAAVLSAYEPYADAAELAAVREVAAASPRASARAFTRAIALRETLSAVFGAIAGGDAPPDTEFAALQDWIDRAGARLRLMSTGDGYELRPMLPPDSGTDALDLPLWTMALSAAALLTSDRLHRVRACPGPNCGWLFVDTTRNGSRRWCDPGECGNRERVRAHYRRTRAAAR